MMKIVTLENTMLATTSEPVTDINGEIREFVTGMQEAMNRFRGIGLAAVQVGRLIRLFVTHVTDDRFRVFINPEIIETSVEMNIFEEGCLSIPGINADVDRSAHVRIQAWNENGKPFTLTADGYLARVVQHEYDHLNGVLFIDRLSGDMKKRLVKLYTAQKKAS